MPPLTREYRLENKPVIAWVLTTSKVNEVLVLRLQALTSPVGVVEDEQWESSLPVSQQNNIQSILPARPGTTVVNSIHRCGHREFLGYEHPGCGDNQRKAFEIALRGQKCECEFEDD